MYFEDDELPRTHHVQNDFFEELLMLSREMRCKVREVLFKGNDQTMLVDQLDGIKS